MALYAGPSRDGAHDLAELLKEPSHLDAEGRGWALRNISHTLPDDPEALRDAQLSSDAFLEAGNKVEAGQSLMRGANILMKTEPREAVKKLNEMVAVLEKEDLLDRRVRGAALQARPIGSPSFISMRTLFATPSRQ